MFKQLKTPYQYFDQLKRSGERPNLPLQNLIT